MRACTAREVAVHGALTRTSAAAAALAKVAYVAGCDQTAHGVAEHARAPSRPALRDSRSRRHRAAILPYGGRTVNRTSRTVRRGGTDVKSRGTSEYNRESRRTCPSPTSTRRATSTRLPRAEHGGSQPGWWHATCRRTGERASSWSPETPPVLRTRCCPCTSARTSTRPTRRRSAAATRSFIR